MAVVILGAGGFGRHVSFLLRDNGAEVLGFCDDGEVRHDLLKHPFLGSTTNLADFAGHEFVAAVGSPRVRRLLAERALAAGLHPATLIHHSATVADDAHLAPGAVICAGARIGTNVTLGAFAHINQNCTVGHDVVCEDYVTVFPLVAIGGESVVKRGVTCGAGATINPRLTVGEEAYIAAGATVIAEVPARTLVAGVPAVVKKEL